MFIRKKNFNSYQQVAISYKNVFIFEQQKCIFSQINAVSKLVYGALWLRYAVVSREKKLHLMWNKQCFDNCALFQTELPGGRSKMRLEYKSTLPLKCLPLISLTPPLLPLLLSSTVFWASASTELPPSPQDEEAISERSRRHVPMGEIYQRMPYFNELWKIFNT